MAERTIQANVSRRSAAPDTLSAVAPADADRVEEELASFAERESGNILIGERVRVGQTFRFHVRDATSAHDDLRSALRSCSSSAAVISGGLLFSCNGRGQHLFAEPDHDASMAAEILGPLPIAGMFCNGEIGPVGGGNFLHGFTATMLLFEETGSS